MSLTAEVEQAIAEVRDAHPDSEVKVVEDGHGGAFVTVDPVWLGERFSPDFSWINFHITFQYPLADVYPHFIRPDLVRVDGAAPATGTPLGTGSAAVQFQAGGPVQSGIQLSQRSNRLNPATDTAALKLEKVLTWLRGGL